MPPLPCPCGYLHPTSEVPDAAWLTVKDSDMAGFLAHSRTYEDGFYEPEGDPARTASDHSGLQLISLQGRLYECPACGVILWRSHPGQDFRAFRPLLTKGT